MTNTRASSASLKKSKAKRKPSPPSRSPSASPKKPQHQASVSQSENSSDTEESLAIPNINQTDSQGVFPSWMTVRKDFQVFFPRFVNGTLSEEDMFRMAASKRMTDRNSRDLAVISTWIRTQVPSMEKLNDQQGAEIAQLCKFIEVPEGEFVFEQDDPGDACYICFSGHIDVIVNGTSVCRMGKSAVFGELALEVPGRVRSAGIKCASTCELIKIAADSYRNTLQRYHANQRKQMIKWLRRKVDMLGDFSEHRIKYFESVCVDIVLNAGESIFEEESEVGPIYFIKSGSVKLEKNVTFQRTNRIPVSGTTSKAQVRKKSTNIHVSTETTGDYFGCETFLGTTQRTHTATAVTSVHLIAINKVDCNTFLFQGRSIELMMEKYHMLYQACQAKGAQILKDDQDAEKAARRITQEVCPVVMLAHFPSNKGSATLQFPVLVKGSKLSTENEVLREYQDSLTQANGNKADTNAAIIIEEEVEGDQKPLHHTMRHNSTVLRAVERADGPIICYKPTVDDICDLKNKE